MNRLIMTTSLLLTLMLGLLGGGALVSAGSTETDNGTDGTDYDCSDFPLQGDAQAYFEADGGSADRNVDFLDSNDGEPSADDPNDSDGVVCDFLAPGGGNPNAPVLTPTGSPSATATTTATATATATDEPTATATEEPTVQPTATATEEPTVEPTARPSRPARETTTPETSAAPAVGGGDLPITGTGPIGSSSVGTATILLALLAAIASVLGVLSIVRSRRI